MSDLVPYAPTPISKEFGAALATAQSEMETVTRNATNPAFKRGLEPSRYADISAILEAVKPALNKHGIALTMPALNREDGCVGAYLELRFEAETIVVPPFWIKPASGIPHAMVSALTYARRAAVTSYFSIPQEDDDGNTASDHGNEGRAEYAAPTNKRDPVKEAAEREAEERDEAERKSATKAQQSAEAKEAFAEFSTFADDYGFGKTDRPALQQLARKLLKKDRPGTADIIAATLLPSHEWNLAIDDTNAALAKVEVDTANLTPPPADPQSEMSDHERAAYGMKPTAAESTATVGALSR